MRDLEFVVVRVAVPFRKVWSRGVACAVSVELVDRRLVYAFEFLLSLSFFFLHVLGSVLIGPDR